MAFLAFILKFLGGGVLKSVLGHLENKANNETERERIRTSVTIEEVRAELGRRNAQKEVLLKESESSIQWMPRFLFGMTAWFYFCAVVIDAIFDLPGVVLELPTTEAAVIATIVGGLFLESVGTKVARSIAKK